MTDTTAELDVVDERLPPPELFRDLRTSKRRSRLREAARRVSGVIDRRLLVRAWGLVGVVSAVLE